MPLTYSAHNHNINNKINFDFKATKDEVGLRDIDSFLGKTLPPVINTDKDLIAKIIRYGSEFDQICTAVSLQDGHISVIKKLTDEEYYFSVKF